MDYFDKFNAQGMELALLLLPSVSSSLRRVGLLFYRQNALPSLTKFAPKRSISVRLVSSRLRVCDRHFHSSPDYSRKFRSVVNESPNKNPNIWNAYFEGVSRSKDLHRWRHVMFRLIRIGGVVVILLISYTLLMGVSVAIVNSPSAFLGMPQEPLQSAGKVNVTFKDVQGCDEAKQELEDVVDFLRQPETFTRLGANPPKGVLLVGPAGVGKTLLAKAVAGEARVNFIHISGSDFDETFVGSGANRVRQVFREAKQRAPCIIFIDEFDALGQSRPSSALHPYAAQTVNQLLTDMDGFTPSDGIILLAATNKKEYIDSALLRPGRFDMQVHIRPPDLVGRVALFRLYLSKVTLSPASEVMNHLEQLAAGTRGFTGADIQAMVNQAAINAGQSQREHVTIEDLWLARDRRLMGIAKKRILDQATNENIATGLAAAVLVTLHTPDSQSLLKVCLAPRDENLGSVSLLPQKERYSETRGQMLATIDLHMARRVAEEVVYGSNNTTTTGASSFEKATRLAETMVRQLGMSEKVGPRILPKDGSQWSVSTKESVDAEVNRLLRESHERVRVLLQRHQKEHRLLVQALLTYETLDRDDVETVLKGGKPKAGMKLKEVQSSPPEPTAEPF